MKQVKTRITIEALKTEITMAQAMADTIPATIIVTHYTAADFLGTSLASTLGVELAKGKLLSTSEYVAVIAPKKGEPLFTPYGKRFMEAIQAKEVTIEPATAEEV